MKDKPLTVIFYVGDTKVEKLTDEQIKRITERLSETMSAYYTAHPEEYKKLKDEK